MTITHRRLLALALIAAVAALPACKKAQDAAVEAAMEKASGMKVDKDGNAVTIKTEQGDLKIATVSGRANLNDEDGLIVAGIKVQLARAEMMRKSKRQSRAQRQRAKVETGKAGILF